MGKELNMSTSQPLIIVSYVLMSSSILGQKGYPRFIWPWFILTSDGLISHSRKNTGGINNTVDDAALN